MRRVWSRLGVVAASAAGSLAACGAAASVQPPNPIQLENALPGTPAGLIPLSGTGAAVEGYASEVSALPGDTLHFHVSANPAGPYRVEVYRLGWYGGAGARLVGCVPTCGSFATGQPQPAVTPRSDGLVQAGWPVTDSFQLPADAASGFYRIRFLLASGQSSATYVIVRAPPSAPPSAILVQVPVNTWQAYNSWGARSLYDLPGAARANRVSFDRPYAWTAAGNQNPLGWEYPFVLFLEQNGYDVSYQADVDTDADPSSLLGHRLVIALGHDEYWTQQMRDAFKAARDQGVNLAFMGANAVYWRVRYEDGGRTIVDYKSGDDPVVDPRVRTGYFRVLDTPECRLIGVQHQGGELNWPAGDYTVVPAALDSSLGRRWFAGTGFAPASVVKGVAGVETDSIPSWDGGATCGHQLTAFFQRDMGGDVLGNADATAYTASSGAVVFDAGSKRFVWGLADPPAITGRTHSLVDPRLQRFVTNMLDDLAARNVVNLNVTLSTRASAVAVGHTLSVHLLVTNSGPDPASAATVTLTVPAGLSFVRVSSSGLRCTIAPVQCTVATLAPGGSIAAAFTLRATTTGTHTVDAHAFTLIATDTEPATATRELAIHCARRSPPPPSGSATN